ncbi:MAG: secondary thiamine-phosphate synthase enzyme YjbQ [Candidatus Hodarchaeales archaeon]|jgi:secondary thiamine-phosphate synthase enzyme
MTVFQSEIRLNRTHETEIVDISVELNRIVDRSGIKNGLISVFNAGSTGAIIALEYEPGLLKDIPDLLERLAPKDLNYLHDQTWHDGNGHSHVRASLLGPSLTVPIKGGNMIHGTWQQIAFIELDIKPRNRNLFVTVIGE